MFQNNPLLAQLKQQLHKETPRIEGTVRAHEKGYGFLELDNNKKSYYIPNTQMRKLVHGDRVSGILQQQDGKEQFEPESLIETPLVRFIARVAFENNHLVLHADHLMTRNTIRGKVMPSVKQRLEAGDWVIAELKEHPLKKDGKHFSAEVTEFITHKNNKLALWLITLTRHNLETETPEDVQLELLAGEEKNRQDLTNEPFFTIDSADTYDMDDALKISLDEHGNYLLSVAIADPTAYIAENSPLDNVAKHRIFTTYLPNYHVSMLPQNVANDLCSLKAKAKRPAIVCNVMISPQGQILKDATFTLAWIESKAKLAYHLVSDYLENKGDWQPDNEQIKQQFPLLVQMANARIQWRNHNAILFQDQSDYRFILDEQNQVQSIVKEERRTANKIVEEAMIAANKALATQLENTLGFGVFSAHIGFDPKYLETVHKILVDNQITQFDKEALASFDGYIQLKRLTQNNSFLDARLRRYLAPADFTFQPRPHFGLGFKLYTTWTSPIRKYSDMLNHHLIKAMIRQQQFVKPEESILEKMVERRKQMRGAERDLSNYLYAQYLLNKIDEPFAAEIVDINKGGIKVKLTEIGAMAFMPASLIHPVKEDVTISPDEGLLKIKDQTTYRIADRLTVQISEVKPEYQAVIAKPASALNQAK
ncbi:exoribonuclease II [Zophobihabitans entericus]|uniref:Exoribonuclease II n=1 Tax=Zophobihabitans entericus TaxID=1635327 RepID=A0A6G9IDI8_9GAMM|nr:exoribonuclease II [Zophobihabitans entericus]QIQ21879.1 exoribonuclease II [Zophobihabitans entericus]